VATIYTIGHSTRTLDELVTALKAHGIRTLVDIRSFPMSRRLPHFSRESLEVELPRHGIAYFWRKELGGRRKKVRDDSPNTGLRSAGFRNYADYMLTEEFARGIERLLAIAQSQGANTSTSSGQALGHRWLEIGQQAAGPSTAFGPALQDLTPLGMTNVGSGGNTAIMCAERLYFKCHRMLVSDYLTAHGHTVLHIDDENHPPREHTLMAGARLLDGKLVYNAQQLF